MADDEEDDQWKPDDQGEASQSYQESLEGEESVEDLDTNTSPPPGSRSNNSRLTRSKSPGGGLNGAQARGVRFAKGGSTDLHAAASSSSSSSSARKPPPPEEAPKRRVAVSLQQTRKKSDDDDLPVENGGGGASRNDDEDEEDEVWNGSDGYGTDDFEDVDEEVVEGTNSPPLQQHASNLSIAVDMDDEALERVLGNSIARGGGHGHGQGQASGRRGGGGGGSQPPSTNSTGLGSSSRVLAVGPNARRGGQAPRRRRGGHVPGEDSRVSVPVHPGLTAS